MRITWYGQSCFLLTTAQGTAVVLDPYDSKMGFPPHRVRADIVTISHEHHDHNSLDWIDGAPEVFRGIGRFAARDVSIHGFASFHDDKQGAQRGPNTLFRIQADGLTILHLGDLGHVLTKELMAEIGPVDVLLLPVGGYYTIDHTVARAVQQAIKPALTIPMHFNATGNPNLPIATVEPFAVLAGAQRAGGSAIDVQPGHWAGQTIILEYER